MENTKILTVHQGYNLDQAYIYLHHPSKRWSYKGLAIFTYLRNPTEGNNVQGEKSILPTHVKLIDNDGGAALFLVLDAHTNCPTVEGQLSYGDTVSFAVRKIQGKDIPSRPIIEFVAKHGGIGCTWFKTEWADGSFTYSERSVYNAMPIPDHLPDRLVFVKMNNLIKKGYLDGCTCGCRGDYEISEKGINFPCPE